MAYNGSILFEAGIDNKLMEQELTRLKRKFLKFQEDITSSKVKKDAVTEQLQNARKELDGLQSAQRSSKGGSLYSPEEVERIVELKGQISTLTELENQYTAAIRESEASIEGLKVRYGEVYQELTRMQEATPAPEAPATQDVEQATERTASTV